MTIKFLNQNHLPHTGDFLKVEFVITTLQIKVARLYYGEGEYDYFNIYVSDFELAKQHYERHVAENGHTGFLDIAQFQYDPLGVA
jgi:hypothetical protein